METPRISPTVGSLHSYYIFSATTQGERKVEIAETAAQMSKDLGQAIPYNELAIHLRYSFLSFVRAKVVMGAVHIYAVHQAGTFIPAIPADVNSREILPTYQGFTSIDIVGGCSSHLTQYREKLDVVQIQGCAGDSAKINQLRSIAFSVWFQSQLDLLAQL